MLVIYHNPRCRKSRETLALLENSGEPFEVREYLKTPPTKEELSKVLEKLNMSPQEIIRRGESIYKEKFKGKELSETEWLQALVDHPKLIERPIVIKGDLAIIGRPPTNIQSLL